MTSMFRVIRGLVNCLINVLFLLTSLQCFFSVGKSFRWILQHHLCRNGKIIIYLGFFQMIGEKWCRISLIWKTFYFIICSLDRFLSNILFWIESLNITHVPGRARSAFCCSFCICSTFSWFLYSWNVAYSLNLTFCSFCFVEMMIYINMDCISHCTETPAQKFST